MESVKLSLKVTLSITKKPCSVFSSYDFSPTAQHRGFLESRRREGLWLAVVRRGSRRKVLAKKPDFQIRRFCLKQNLRGHLRCEILSEFHAEYVRLSVNQVFLLILSRRSESEPLQATAPPYAVLLNNHKPTPKKSATPPHTALPISAAFPDGTSSVWSYGGISAFLL